MFDGELLDFGVTRSVVITGIGVTFTSALWGRLLGSFRGTNETHVRPEAEARRNWASTPEVAALWRSR
jgi:hypothetical protein